MRKCAFILVVIIVCAAGLHAQCPSGRYLNEIFPSVTVDSVQYSSAYNLMMDIYQPTGDTMTARPLIILAHGGSFVGGNREDDTAVMRLDTNFAKRGYVTASIDYRLTNYASVIDSAAMTNEVVQAISDGKAAVRFFMKDAATTNTYKIDTNNIFIGGNSAGAVLYMHVGYIKNLAACPPGIAAAMAANGGFEGNSGNAGYTTKSKAIIDLAGGLNETSFITPGSKPSVNAQGSADNVVPYTCGYPLGGICPITLCGLGSLEPVYDSNGVNHMSYVFPGAGHVPWQSDLTDFHTVDSMITVFLYNMVCTGILPVNSVTAQPELEVYPNPATDETHIYAGQALDMIQMYDQTGRMVVDERKIRRNNYDINTSRLSRGIYFLKITFADGEVAPVVKKLIVE